ncbi:hypothetical protein P5673_018127 [Acropora cervicornis]|uniref:Uncharacterized protein n=1 Tax=Acropora cervicornis TaxID=6130 RepID=A0AAD9QE10_ACRCE|nr:hypothetical protein P5673_018127 [Acropora cervicornis]
MACYQPMSISHTQMQRKWKKMSKPASIYKEVDKLKETFFQRNYSIKYRVRHFNDSQDPVRVIFISEDFRFSANKGEGLVAFDGKNGGKRIGESPHFRCLYVAFSSLCSLKCQRMHRLVS